MLYREKAVNRSSDVCFESPVHESPRCGAFQTNHTPRVEINKVLDDKRVHVRIGSQEARSVGVNKEGARELADFFYRLSNSLEG